MVRMRPGHPHVWSYPEHECEADIGCTTFLENAALFQVLLLLYNQRFLSSKLQGTGPRRTLLLFHKPSEQKLKCHRTPGKKLN